VLSSSDGDLPDGVSSPRQNRLLDALPVADYQRFAVGLTRVSLRANELLNAMGREPRYIYFPVSSVLSVQCLLDDGKSCEVAAIGREGLFSAELLLDDAAASHIVLVQSPGTAYRADARHVEREFRRGTAFQQLVLHHMRSLFMQVAQTSSCNRVHSLEQRMCRWLLGMFERDRTRELTITHEQLALVLGVRRESVSEAAGRLQQLGAIRYQRGRVAVLAPRALETRACRCHAVLQQLYLRPPQPFAVTRPTLYQGRCATLAT
jgi:CRP-like cAMP-binding protein